MTGDLLIYLWSDNVKGDRLMIFLTLISSGAMILIGSIWLYGKLAREDKVLFVELFDEN